MYRAMFNAAFSAISVRGVLAYKTTKKVLYFQHLKQKSFFESHLAFIERGSQNHELTTEITTVIVFPFFSLPSHINRMRAFLADFRKIGKFLN